jgi:hypothetical protein
MSDGIKSKKPDIPRDSSRKDKQGDKLPAFRGEGIHSAYETQTINMAARKGLLFKEIRKNLGADHGMKLAKDGRGAAVATLTCMRDVAKILPPRRLIDAYEKSFSEGSPPHTQALWNAFADETGKVMALGARTLAMIWDAAWKAGGGQTGHGRMDPGVLRSHYEDVNFVRSVTVDEIEQEIANPSLVGGSRTSGCARTASRGTARPPRRPPAKRAASKKTARRRR